MKTINVAFDCDGPIVEFARRWFSIASELARHDYTSLRDAPYSYNLGINLRPEHRHFEDQVYEHMRGRGQCLSLFAVPGAIDAIRKIQEIPHVKVWIITAPLGGKYWMEEREEWAARHLGLTKNHVIHARQKHLFGADILLEDSIKNAVAWHQQHPDRRALLWDMPCNIPPANDPHFGELASCPLIERVYDWSRVRAVVDELVSSRTT